MIITGNNAPLIKQDESSHWYQVMDDGSVEARHDAGLREARKHNLYASPTSIEKDIRANPLLANWLKNELAKAFLRLPRLGNESDADYVARVVKAADSRRDTSATLGTAIHKAIEDEGTNDPQLQPFYQAYAEWATVNVDQTISRELKIADTRIGVAGTVDRVIRHKEHGLTVIDFKTQRVKDGKAAFYESFPRQLSFYAAAYAYKNSVPIPRIMSVVMDSQKAGAPQTKLYTPEQQQQSYKEFLCHVWLWSSVKNHWPAGRWDVSFTL